MRAHSGEVRRHLIRRLSTTHKSAGTCHERRRRRGTPATRNGPAAFFLTSSPDDADGADETTRCRAERTTTRLRRLNSRSRLIARARDSGDPTATPLVEADRTRACWKRKISIGACLPGIEPRNAHAAGTKCEPGRGKRKEINDPPRERHLSLTSFLPASRITPTIRAPLARRRGLLPSYRYLNENSS
ncbi:hypothetical protein PUN28_018548 [Cardiocondyla obscurior]|uniref:Uncharacterized protein n=1 Tax=Cardiocondyla obscurior TaxID=286306 RepID=A0AAW2EK91_9HYME